MLNFSIESDGQSDQNRPSYQESECWNEYDTFKVFDGPGIDSPQNAYCGDAIPETVISTGRYMYVVFKSDQSKSGTGYLASVSFIQGKHLLFIITYE